MKKNILILLFLFSVISFFAQEKDTRAKLEIKGRTREISVSPDGKIWLVTATGNTYYTNSIDSNWHYGNPIFWVKKKYDSFDSPTLERISFFNENMAILTGYISKDTSIFYRKDGYYRTINGGESWELLDFGGESWIYTAFSDNAGNAWLGGSCKQFFISQDFGKTWKLKKIRPKSFSSDRIYAIYMENAKAGMIGMDYNKLLKSNNNWKTYKSIKTPLDQIKNNKKASRFHSDITKVGKWGNYIVLNQLRNTYYSDEKKFFWKRFPDKRIIDFAIDEQANLLYGLTDSLDIVLFYSPEKYDIISKNRLKDSPEDMKVVNGSLYILTKSNEIYKINSNEFIHHIPYTYESKIPKPDIVRKYKDLTWGISGKQVYLSEKDTMEWYRIDVLDFEVEDFILLNDSQAVLWDGKSKSYLYSLSDRTLKPYSRNNPINDFLNYPLKSLFINVKYSSDPARYESIAFKSENDSILTISNSQKALFLQKSYNRFHSEVNSCELLKILTFIDSNPQYIPSLSEFQISEEDKNNYLLEVDDRYSPKSLKERRRYKQYSENAKAFYITVPQMLDTLNDNIIKIIYNQKKEFKMRYKCWFSVQLTNSNNDTLTIKQTYYLQPFSWNLPWIIEYKGHYFNCYNVDLSRFISFCIPDDFRSKKMFDNQYLIMEIADYLYRK